MLFFAFPSRKILVPNNLSALPNEKNGQPKAKTASDFVICLTIKFTGTYENKYITYSSDS